MLTEREIELVTADITYKDHYSLLYLIEQGTPSIRVGCMRPDALTGERGLGYGPITPLPNVTESRVVRAAFAAFMAYEEHECREWFKYRDAAVFNPHIDVQALLSVAGKRE